MTRFALFAAALAGVLSAAPSQADVAVAPPPRPVRPDGTRDPVPDAAAKKEDPAEVVDRIIKNSKAVGDQLARTDTGTGTRGKQATILKDIDKLLDQQEPPPSGGGGGSKDKNDQKDKDKNKDDMGNSGGTGGMPPPKGGKQPDDGVKEGKEPKGDGNQQANSGRKPRNGGGQPKGKEPTGTPKADPGGTAKAAPMPGPAGPGGKEPKGAMAGGADGKGPPKATLPLTDEVVKDVWGHLPDKLRQQVTQYYKEEFMPRYSDLLKQYYSSLANAPAKPDTRK